jgi:hypothetical protein
LRGHNFFWEKNEMKMRKLKDYEPPRTGQPVPRHKKSLPGQRYFRFDEEKESKQNRNEKLAKESVTAK